MQLGSTHTYTICCDQDPSLSPSFGPVHPSLCIPLWASHFPITNTIYLSSLSRPFTALSQPSLSLLHDCKIINSHLRSASNTLPHLYKHWLHSPTSVPFQNSLVPCLLPQPSLGSWYAEMITHTALSLPLHLHLSLHSKGELLGGKGHVFTVPSTIGFAQLEAML